MNFIYIDIKYDISDDQLILLMSNIRKMLKEFKYNHFKFDYKIDYIEENIQK